MADEANLMDRLPCRVFYPLQYILQCKSRTMRLLQNRGGLMLCAFLAADNELSGFGSTHSPKSSRHLQTRGHHRNDVSDLYNRQSSVQSFLSVFLKEHTSLYDCNALVCLSELLKCPGQQKNVNLLNYI